MNPASMKPTQRTAVLGVIDPQTVASGANVVSPWVPMAGLNRVLATLLLGAIGGGGTVDAKFQQATKADGTGTKDVDGRGLTQLTAAGGAASKQAQINLKAEDLDVNGGFAFVRLYVAAGGASATLAAALQGFDFREEPASDNAAATVVQTVG